MMRRTLVAAGLAVLSAGSLYAQGVCCPPPCVCIPDPCVCPIAVPQATYQVVESVEWQPVTAMSVQPVWETQYRQITTTEYHDVVETAQVAVPEVVYEPTMVVQNVPQVVGGHWECRNAVVEVPADPNAPQYVGLRRLWHQSMRWIGLERTEPMLTQVPTWVQDVGVAQVAQTVSVPRTVMRAAEVPVTRRVPVQVTREVPVQVMRVEQQQVTAQQPVRVRRLVRTDVPVQISMTATPIGPAVVTSSVPVGQSAMTAQGASGAATSASRTGDFSVLRSAQAEGVDQARRDGWGVEPGSQNSGAGQVAPYQEPQGPQRPPASPDARAPRAPTGAVQTADYQQVASSAAGWTASRSGRRSVEGGEAIADADWQVPSSADIAAALRRYLEARQVDGQVGSAR